LAEETKEISKQKDKIEMLNKETDVIDRERRSDFMERAEHIMKVDQFIAKDFKIEEQKNLHLKVVEKYRDSLI